MAEENEAGILGEDATEEGALRELIEQRAYELYEQRGREDGFHTQDWVQAEQEIMGRTERADTSADERNESGGQVEVGAKAARQT